VARESEGGRAVDRKKPELTPLQLEAGAARVLLLPAIGGAIGAFTWRDAPVLRPMPDDAIAATDVRRAASYPLVPYSNRIRDAQLAFSGNVYALGRNFGDHPHAIHGVGWQRVWNVIAASTSRAVLTFEHNAQGDETSAWPWPFRALQCFDLTADTNHATLTATLTIKNTGPVPFPFGLGWHPYFPHDATTTASFVAQSVWINDATQLPQRQVETRGQWDFGSPRPFGDDTIDNVFCIWNGIATLHSPARGIATTIEADSACRWLVVYAPAGRDFVALEPVTHETDAFNRHAAGETHTGTRVLPPGAAFSCTMRIAVAAL
jgi:aldose 1-epimerase